MLKTALIAVSSAAAALFIYITFLQPAPVDRLAFAEMFDSLGTDIEKTVDERLAKHETQALALTRKELRRSESKLAQQIREEIGTNAGNLISRTEVRFVDRRDTLIRTRDSLIYVDSNKQVADTVHAFNYNDNALKLKGVFLPTGLLDLTYKYRADISFNVFKQRKPGIRGWFSQPITKVQATTENKNMEFTRLRTVAVLPDKKRRRRRDILMGVIGALAAGSVATFAATR